MRLTDKREGRNVIPLRKATAGIGLPYWRIDVADDGLGCYLSGDAADKLAAYEDAEEQGRLVVLPCKVGDMVYYRCGSNPYAFQRNIIGDTVERIILDGIDNQVLVGAHKVYLFRDFGRNVFLKEAEAVLKEGDDE